VKTGVMNETRAGDVIKTILFMTDLKAGMQNGPGTHRFTQLWRGIAAGSQTISIPASSRAVRIRRY
jgi:hypothetical protein